MDKKDQLINETLISFEGIQKAEADPFLYEKVMNKIQLRKKEAVVYVKNYRWQLAALSFLLILNSYFLLKNDTSTTKQNSNSSFANEYFGSNNTYNY